MRGRVSGIFENGSWVKLGIAVEDLPTPDAIMAMSAVDYSQFGESYFERSIDSDLVELVFEGKFQLEVAQQLNPNVDLKLLADDIKQIGEIA